MCNCLSNDFKLKTLLNRTPDVVACFACLHEEDIRIRREKIVGTQRKNTSQELQKLPNTSVLEVSVPSVFSILSVLSDLSVVFLVAICLPK